MQSDPVEQAMNRAARELIIHSAQPLNAEPRLDRLRADLITPSELFYIRSHGGIPKADMDGYRLQVGGRVQRALDLGLADLRKRFAERRIAAVLQCAGNRRADLLAVRPVSGEPWEAGAIGNAIWGGVALADVLRAAGAAEAKGLHVAFECLDEIELGGERFSFGVSIPIEKALSPEVLLALEMNGEPLAPEHGFPLRLITPGYAGVRSPKWVTAITVQDAASENPMQRREYKMMPPDAAEETADWSRAVTINEMPLNSAICDPAAHAELKAGRVMLRGYAIATRREIVRVDVSADGGRAWRQAGLEPGGGAPWSWCFWCIEVELPQGEHELAVRAWDSAGQTQPALPDDVWNFKGYLSAAWHRIAVRAV